MLLEIITFVISLIFVTCIFVKRNYNYWKTCGVDSVPAVFPFGSVKSCLLLKRNIGEVFAEWYRKHDGKKFVGFYGPFDAFLLIRDPELIRTILVKEFTSFVNTGMSTSKSIDPLLAYNPFGETGYEQWKAARSIESPALSLSKIKLMSNDLVKSAENMSKYIATKIGQPIEVKSLMNKYLVDGLLSAAYGVESDSFSGKGNEFYHGGDMFVDSNDSNYAALSGMFLPFANQIFRWRTLSKSLEKSFLDLSKTCIAHRKKNGIVRNDVIQNLINYNEKAISEDRKPLSDIEMATHCVAVYGDGVDTVGLILSSTIFQLAIDSRVQEKLRTEIFSKIQDFNNFDYDILQSIEYLEMVVTESLRLHPPVPFLSRTCSKKIKLENVTLEEGMKVFIPTFGIHTDPKFYSQPEEFLPERFTKEFRSNMNKFTYLPFGEGPRMCLGYRLAQTEIKVCITALLMKYRMSLAKTDGKNKWEIDPGTIFLMAPKGNIDVIFTPL